MTNVMSNRTESTQAWDYQIEKVTDDVCDLFQQSDDLEGYLAYVRPQKNRIEVMTMSECGDVVHGFIKADLQSENVDETADAYISVDNYEVIEAIEDTIANEGPFKISIEYEGDAGRICFNGERLVEGIVENGKTIKKVCAHVDNLINLYNDHWYCAYWPDPRATHHLGFLGATFKMFRRSDKNVTITPQSWGLDMKPDKGIDHYCIVGTTHDQDIMKDTPCTVDAEKLMRAAHNIIDSRYYYMAMYPNAPLMLYVDGKNAHYTVYIQQA